MAVPYHGQAAKDIDIVDVLPPVERRGVDFARVQQAVAEDDSVESAEGLDGETGQVSCHLNRRGKPGALVGVIKTWS